MKYGYARVSTDDQTPALLRCLKKLEPGDTLIVWKLDRLGRSLRDLITMLDDFRTRGVKFRSLTEHIDTDTPTGRAMWQMIGLLAELERSLINERTRAGVKAAKRRGVKFGRKPKLTPQQLDHARKLIDKGEHNRQGMANLSKSPAPPFISGACQLTCGETTEILHVSAGVQTNLLTLYADWKTTLPRWPTSNYRSAHATTNCSSFVKFGLRWRRQIRPSSPGKTRLAAIIALRSHGSMCPNSAFRSLIQ